MKEIILDTLIDGAKLIPFLFIAFLLIEYMEHRISKSSQKTISSSGRLGPIIGSLLGAIPQCGFGVLATNLYVTRIISIGTLISIYLSTSDEMLPILISSGASVTEILKLLGIKVLVGMIFGFIIDLIFRKKAKKDFHICEDEDCDCDESIIKSSLIHTLKTLVFILVISFILNVLMEYVDIEKIEKIFMKNSIFAPFVSSLIGLIPNCGASVVITELYLSKVITVGTCIGGLLTNSGISLLILFKSNKDLKENILVLLSLYVIGSLVGLLLNLIGV